MQLWIPLEARPEFTKQYPVHEHGRQKENWENCFARICRVSAIVREQRTTCHFMLKRTKCDCHWRHTLEELSGGCRNMDGVFKR